MLITILHHHTLIPSLSKKHREFVVNIGIEIIPHVIYNFINKTLLFTHEITADGDCRHEIKRCLLHGRKAMSNLDSILKSRDINLPTKVQLVKAIFFPVVMHGCESWTI